MVQVGLDKKQDLISKITRAKWAGSMVQVVDCLRSNCEALSSNPHTLPTFSPPKHIHTHTHTTEIGKKHINMLAVIATVCRVNG
jgi:hypothetical protein